MDAAKLTVHGQTFNLKDAYAREQLNTKISAPQSASANQFLGFNGTDWVAVTLINYAGEVV